MGKDIQVNIARISNEILDHLLQFKALNPDFTFPLRQRNTNDKLIGTGRLDAGYWFQGASNYIYVPLFTKGDNSRMINTVGFAVNINKDGEILNNQLSISFKSGVKDSNEQSFHRELANLHGIILNKSNHGVKNYDDPERYIENLNNYITSFRPVAIELLKKYNLKDKYILSENEFQKQLRKINKYKEALNNSKYLPIKESEQQSEIRSFCPLNQILYGPPGTGKTYNTINKALEIINDDEVKGLDWSKREVVKELYNKKVENGQIVFTTFHQSMSYEDFVEGIKPQTIDEKVVYEVEAGIFKNICEKAMFTKGNFEEVLEKFKLKVTQGSNEKPLTIKSKATYFDIEYRGTNVFYVQPHSSVKENPWYPVNIENVKKAFETGNYKNIYNPTYVREIIAYLEREYNLQKDTGGSEEPYVLIIDEINRGNVSAIFGELITLIEESKRKPINENDKKRCTETLEVTLPYSKQKFSVPSNLYIIGTMNTADRSVEALDTALRRRFAFTEMMPQPELLKDNVIEDIKLEDVLTIINKRIKILLDADHQIGHSYLINVETKEELVHAFKNCIVPLLQEYFYHDEEKIALVLGEGFVGVEDESVSATTLFPSLSFGNGLPAIKRQYVLKPVDSNSIINALQALVN